MRNRNTSRTPNLRARLAVVNLLEGLYLLTAIVLVAAGVQLVRRKRTSAKHLLWLGVLGAGVSILLYWSLRPPA
jgi:hypothetical protein